MMPILMRDRTNNNGSNHLLDQKIVYTYFGWDHVLLKNELLLNVKLYTEKVNSNYTKFGLFCG